jgi:O-antigen ligase
MIENNPEIKHINYFIVGSLLLVIITNYLYYFKQVGPHVLHIYGVVTLLSAWFTSGFNVFSKIISGRFFIFSLTLISFFISSYLSPIVGYGFCLFFFMGFTLLLSFSQTDTSFPYILKFTLYASLLCALSVIFSAFATSSYFSTLSLFFDANMTMAINRLVSAENYGGYAPLTATAAFLLSIGIGVLFVRLINTHTKNYILWGILLIFLLALFLTQRRVGILCNIIAIAAVLLYKREYLFRFLLILVILIILYYWLLPYIPQLGNVFRKHEELMREGDITSGREDLYDYALQLFKEKPYWGNGPLSFVALRQQYLGVESSLGVHNVFLQLLAETGIIGMVLFTTCVSTLLYQTYRSLKEIKLQLYHDEETLLNDEKLLMTSLYIQIVFLFFCMSESALSEYNMFYSYLIFAAIPVYYYQKLIVNKEDLSEKKE